MVSEAIASTRIGLLEHMADGVGFEPTGLSPHRFSRPRQYNHFGNHPCWRREEDLNLHALKATDGLANRSLTIRVTSPYWSAGVDSNHRCFCVRVLQTPALAATLPTDKWSEWRDSNSRLSGPRPDALAKLSYAPIIGGPSGA